MATVPYLTEDQIRKNYANAYNAYNTQRKSEADRASAAANQQYDNMQRSNYVDYRMNQRDMPEQLARQGITGGASETSLLRGQTNYENNRAATELQRGSRLGDINNAYLDALATYRMTADQNMNDEITQNRQLRANYEHQIQQETEDRYAKTISGWDSISDIDKEISKIQKSGKNTWRIDYLRARRSELVREQRAEQQAAAAAASRSGGGGYSYSSGGGGGNDDVPYVEPTKPVDTTSAATLGAVAGVLSNKGKGKGKNNSGSGTTKSGNVRKRGSIASRTGNYLGKRTTVPGSAGSYQTSHRAYRKRYKK